MTDPEAEATGGHVAYPATRSIVELLSRVVPDVPGVAFLRPGLIELLHAKAAGTDRLGTSRGGVRVTRRNQTRQWDIEIHIVLKNGYRALDVARAVRQCVARALAEAETDAELARATVTVTNTV